VRGRGRETAVVAALSALFLFLCSFRGLTPLFLFSPVEGGVWIDEAVRVLDGQVMYRDFFEFVPPGIVHLNAAALALLGRGAEVPVLLQVMLGAALAAVVHHLSARLIASPMRFLPAAAFLILAYVSYSPGNHKWPSLLCGMLGLALLDPARGPRRHFAGGLLLGASAVFTLDFGVGLGAAAAAAVATDRAAGARRRALCVAAGWTAAVAAAMAPFVWSAGARIVVYDCLVFPLTSYREKNALFIGLASHYGPRTVAQIVLVLAGAAGAVMLLPRRHGHARLVAAAGLGLLAATAHRPWTPLLVVVRGVPLMVTTAVLLERAWARRGPARAAALGVLGVLMLGTGWGAASTLARRQWLDPLTLERHRAGAVWLPAPLPEVGWLEALVPEGGATFALPHKGGHHFLSRTRAVGSMPYLLDAMSTPQQQEEALRGIERERPPYGVWGNPNDLPAVYAALLRSYEPGAEAPNGSVLLRRRPSP
jgi:hypothetical protein